MTEKTTVPVKAGESRLARWEPFEMLDSLRDEMERIWGRSWPGLAMPPFRRPAPAPVPAAWAPRMDIFEKNGNLVVKAEVPGVKKDDIQVQLDRGDLTIQGERKTESEVKEEDYYRCERSYGSFFRRLPLPFEVKPEQIQAEFKDGVLEIHIPKPVKAKPEPQKIAVK